jgi:hypothetical protein
MVYRLTGTDVITLPSTAGPVHTFLKNLASAMLIASRWPGV